MGKQPSRNHIVKQKRLKRRKVILTIWDYIKSFWKWLICSITFKKSIIVYCLAYVTYYSEFTKNYYVELGLPIPEEIHNTIVKIFLGQLALTAISSLGSRAVEWAETKYGDDENYG